MKRIVRRLFLDPFEDVMAALEQAMGRRRPGQSMVLVVVSLIVSWFVYVPVHEMLHVLGCVATGGTVSELQVDWKYGGAILARWFPFVKVGGEYAGRLTGFDTRGSDLVFLATDFMPFVLTVLLGVPLIHVCTRRQRPLLFGTAVVVGLAPVYQLTGDYFEMASIIVTRILTWISGGGETIVFGLLRSDDIFRLFHEMATKPAELGIGSPLRFAAGAVVVLVSFLVSILLALLTYAAGRRWAKWILRGPS